MKRVAPHHQEHLRSECTPKAVRTLWLMKLCADMIQQE